MRTLAAVALLAVLLAVQPGPAGSYRVIHPVQYRSHDNHRRIVDRVEIRNDVLQINPAYVSAYDPGGYDGTAQAVLLERIDRLTAVVLALQKTHATAPIVIAPSVLPGTAPIVIVPPTTPGTTPVVVQPPKAAPKPGENGLQVLNAHCAACHQAGKAKPDQKFIMLDAAGKLAVLSDLQKRRMLTRAYTKSMPPPLNDQNATALDDAEYALLVDLLQ